MKYVKMFENFVNEGKSLDREIGEGLLTRLMNTTSLEVTKNQSEYSFRIDDFSIKIKESEGPFRVFGVPLASDGGTSYQLYIDDVGIKLNHSLSKKIFDRIIFLFKREEIENSEHIKRDAHINFKNQ